jgi:uncharacterized protein YrzB (UPF0473 family)
MTEQNEAAMDTGADLMTLVDEEGIEHQFEVADSAELDGKNYVALIPVFDDPEEMLEDSGELVILRVEEEDGEEVLDIIEDEAEFDKVGDFFMERLKDTFDFAEDDE